MFRSFNLFINKSFKYKFIGFIAIVFSFFFFNPIDSYAYIPEGNGVEFCGTNGDPIQGFNYDYNVNAYVENVKYIYMYYDSNSIKGHQYEVMVDYAISYNRTYPISMGFIYAHENGIEMKDLKSRLFTTEGQPDGGTGFYQRYKVTLNYTSVVNNGRVRITIELPDVMNIWFYSVYNRTIEDLTPINDDVVGSIENSTDRIIDNQNQNSDAIIDNIDDLNNSINDNNIEGSKDTASSFFDNFTDNDNGGISGIVTAPLVAINAMLNGTCTPLSTTFKGKEISLQCGTQLWSKLTGLKDFLNVVLGGLLCYRICIKLFKLIQNMKNPDNDRVEVMDL